MVVNRQKLSTMTLRPRNAEQADSKGTFKTHSTDHRDPDRSARTGQITPTKRMRAPRSSLFGGRAAVARLPKSYVVVRTFI